MARPYSLKYEHSGPRKGKVNICFALPPEQHEQLQEMREEHNRSMNSMVIEAIEEWLARHGSD